MALGPVGRVFFVPDPQISTAAQADSAPTQSADAPRRESPLQKLVGGTPNDAPVAAKLTPEGEPPMNSAPNSHESEPIDEGAIADEAIAAAERIAFLAMASELARGRKVLVIDDGASALAGIAAHLDSCPIGAVGEQPEGEFDLVVADLQLADEVTSAGVAQLTRVVNASSGAALVRLPNRPEFAPLRQAIESTFTRNLTMRQHNWVASALFDDAMFVNDEPSKAVAASVRKLAAAEPGGELYTVVLAAQGEFPDFRPQLAVTRSLVLRNMIAELHETRERAAADLDSARAESAMQADRIRELEEELAWYDEHQLALRSQIEDRAWAMALVGLWASALVLARRARNVLRGG